MSIYSLKFKSPIAFNNLTSILFLSSTVLPNLLSIVKSSNKPLTAFSEAVPLADDSILLNILEIRTFKFSLLSAPFLILQNNSLGRIKNPFSSNIWLLPSKASSSDIFLYSKFSIPVFFDFH